MKKFIICICSILLLFSCKKGCNISKPKNTLQGKLKEYISYTSELDSTNQIGRYYFKYDSVTGELQNVIASVKLSESYIDSFITIQISREDDTHVLLVYDDIYHYEPEKYSIYHNGKQIISISQIDIMDVETEVTHCYITNNILDSIHDNGAFPSENITLNHFRFTNGNCIIYSGSWNELYPNPVPIHKSSIDTFVYKGLYNTKVTPQQIICTYGFNYYSAFSYLSKITYYLSLDGYYLLKPNNNLIDSIYSGSQYYKFYYEFNNDNIVKCITDRNSSLSITQFIYY